MFPFLNAYRKKICLNLREMISHSKNKYQIPLLFTFKMNRELCNMNLTTFTRSLDKKKPPKNSGQLLNHFLPLFPVNRFAHSSVLLYNVHVQ